WSNDYDPANWTAGCSDLTGSVTVTFTATDSCGNATSTGPVTFTIEDTTAPVLTNAGAQDETITCVPPGTTPLELLQDWLDNNGGAEADDTCGEVLWSYVEDSFVPTCFGWMGAWTYTFTYEDECGNVGGTTTATFSVTDNTPPTFDTLPQDMTVECDGTGFDAQIQAWLDDNGGAEASDDCAGIITWINNYQLAFVNWDCGNDGIGGAMGAGWIEVQFSAIDMCGNVSHESAIFTIEDTTAPTIDTPAADLTV